MFANFHDGICRVEKSTKLNKLSAPTPKLKNQSNRTVELLNKFVNKPVMIGAIFVHLTEGYFIDVQRNTFRVDFAIDI